MNLNISYNWLKEYVKTDLSAQEFAKAISLIGPSVDHITEVDHHFDNVVVGEILEISKHPNADKLNVSKIDVGAKEPIQVIFGQMAVLHVGDRLPVAVAPTELPGGVKIAEREMRGVKSQGMCCLDSELGLSDQVRITLFPSDVKPGTPITKAMGLKRDFILDVEVTSNRPDAMSIVGLAEEASAALGVKNLWQIAKPSLKVVGERKKLAVKVQEKKLCPRYQAIVMSGIEVKASPLWLQQRLISAGLRPINNLVDITNYILLEYGQPMHVFDYDKLSGHEIIVRQAKKGESILALDGKEYALAEGQLIIADKSAPVAVAGIMGGELSAATAETKTIIFECANFDPVSVRKTSRALNLRSDSSNLYEKGISPENTEPALLRAIELAQEIAGAKAANSIIDEKNYKRKAKTIKLELSRVEQILGVAITAAEAKKKLESLGFKVSAKSKSALDVTVPWWRDNDISGDHDLIEEVARLHGYGNLPTRLMATDLPADTTAAADIFHWEDTAKDILAGFGMTEIYTYSFISEKMIIDCGLSAKSHIKIANPLSADFEYMRTTLLPGALQTIVENQGLFPTGQLFDLSKVYLPQGENQLPQERLNLLIAVYGGDAKEALAEAKGALEGLRLRLNLGQLQFADSGTAQSSAMEPLAGIDYQGERIGTIGIVSRACSADFGLKRSVAVIEIDFESLAKSAKSAPEYEPIAKFPAVELDLSMEIDSTISYSQVESAVKQANNGLIEKVEFLSVYEGDKLAAGKKALAVRISYRDKNKTLELKEAQVAHEKVAAQLQKAYNITVR